MKSDKNQTLTLISVAMILIGAVIIIVSLSMPRVYDDSANTSASATSYNTTAVNTVDSNSGNNQTNSYAYQNSQVVSTTTANSGNSSNSVTPSYPLNLNTCTAEELATINGVGDVRANSIIAYREHIGKYTSVEQLKDIKGIGDGVFAKIAPYVTV